ncbi:MAG: hypothetical protein US70_C0008G0017 [Parcubacteria group bacterium GW2011_GWD2_38_11]|nr:MAG: hypothetical protein US70_C0008G0017 [Parcubacteria group bacterium GW2011_GWD2_38_11]
MEKLTQKKIIDRVGLSARVLVVGAILSAVFFLLLIDSFRTYHSEISILISAKSQVAAQQRAQIVSNISELPKTLTFYDRMLKNNSDMRDVAEGLSPQKRKARWNEMLTVERAGFDASVIKVAITTSREADSVQLVNKTTRTLFDTSAFYYNIKKDVDLRIIDGPITRVQVSNWFWLFIFSIIAGFSISGLLQELVFGGNKLSIKKPDFSKMHSFFDFKKNPEMPVEKELESLNNLYRSQQAEESFVFEQDIAPVPEADKKIQEMKKITKQIEPDKYPNFPEMPARNASRSDADGPARNASHNDAGGPASHKANAAAPDNLPIADDSFFTEYAMPAEQIQSQPMEVEQDLAAKETKEPTSEELKKRLNELLKGKI